MIIFLALLFILILTSVKIDSRTVVAANSILQTQTIKGIFIITIFFSHFCSYVHLEQWYDVPMRIYCSFLGQLMVTLFLFYSGFGIFESVKNKGVGYVKAFPQKRILKTLLHFDFAIILFLILDFITGIPVSILEFSQALIAWLSIGNSAWFIFAILCSYIIAFLGFIVFKRNLNQSLIFITIMTFLYIAIISHFKASFWFDTILAFPLGCLLSLLKEKINTHLNRKFAFLVSGLSISVLTLTKTGFIPNIFISSQIALLTFSIALFFLSTQFRLHSKILNWFGANVFGIYILQRIPMNFFAHLHLNDYNIYLFFLVSFGSTLILSILFKKLTNFFDKIFLKIPQS